MKSFYEMIRILEESRGLKEHWADDYGAGDMDGHPVNFSRYLGEDDEDAPFAVEVNINDGHWEAMGPIWVLGYVPNGSENPASAPVRKSTGTEFMKPGKRLELLPVSVRNGAVEWVNKRVQREVERYKPEDPRGHYDDDRGSSYDSDEAAARWEDNYWKHGPGRDPE